MWDDLDNYRPLPECTCDVKCSFDALVNVKKYKTRDRVIRFLKGLNDANYVDGSTPSSKQGVFPGCTARKTIALGRN